MVEEENHKDINKHINSAYHWDMGCLDECHDTELLPCTQQLLQRNYKEEMQRRAELQNSATCQQCMDLEIRGRQIDAVKLCQLIYNI